MNAKMVLDMLMGASQQRAGGGGGGGGGMDLGAVLGQVLGAQRGGGGGQAPAGGGGPDLGAILGQVLGGGQRGQAAPGGGGGGPDLGSILGQVLGGGGGGQMRQAAPQAPQGGGGGLGDLLGQVLGGAQSRGAAPQSPPQGGGGGGLGDLFGQVLGGGGQARQAPPPQAPQGGGGLGDLLGQVLGGGGAGRRAPAPAPEPEAPPAAPGGGSLEEILGQIGAARGLSRDQVLGKLKDFIAENPMATAAGAGGLGAIVLGTKTGRSVAKHAAVIGGLAVIGALAYRAYNNWQTGEQTGAQAALETPPSGSGFESPSDESEQNNNALIMIKAMIASAGADGRIDEAERDKILGNLKSQSLTEEIKQFIQYEIENPADAATLAQYGTTAEMAAQIYTAARLVVDVDTRAEQTFLADLASGLQLDSELVAHIDAQAAGLAG